jgi:hypothetical protein
MAWTFIRNAIRRYDPKDALYPKTPLKSNVPGDRVPGTLHSIEVADRDQK